MANQTPRCAHTPMHVANRSPLILASLLAACSSVQLPERKAPDEPTPLRVAYYVVDNSTPRAQATTAAASKSTTASKTDGAVTGAPAGQARPAVAAKETPRPMLTPAALREAIPYARAFEDTVPLTLEKAPENERQRDLELLNLARKNSCDVCVVFEIAKDVSPREVDRAGWISWNSFFGGFPNLLWMNESIFECAGSIRARAYSVASFRLGMRLPKAFESEFVVPKVALTPDERVSGLGWWLGLALPTCWTPTDESVVAEAMAKRAPEALRQHGLREWAHQDLLPTLDVDVRLLREAETGRPTKLQVTPKQRLKVVRIEMVHEGKPMSFEANKAGRVEMDVPPGFAPSNGSPTMVRVTVDGDYVDESAYSFTFTR